MDTWHFEKLPLLYSLSPFLPLSFSPAIAAAEGEKRWQKDGEDIDDNEKVTTIDENVSKLAILKATLEDAGKYTCICDYDTNEEEAEKQIFVYGM